MASEYSGSFTEIENIGCEGSVAFEHKVMVPGVTGYAAN